MVSDEAVKSPENLEPSQWFVMSPVYQQESKIKSYLDLKGVRCYLPQKSVVKLRYGRKQIIKSPAVRGLLFIYTTERELEQICARHPYLYYKYDRVDGASRKMVVPQKQMEDFLRISSLDDKTVTYFNPMLEELNFEKGEPIRLHSSNPALDGIEGLYIKVRGKREKRLVISLNGCHAVAMMVDVNIIERLQNFKL